MRFSPGKFISWLYFVSDYKDRTLSSTGFVTFVLMIPFNYLSGIIYLSNKYIFHVLTPISLKLSLMYFVVLMYIVLFSVLFIKYLNRSSLQNNSFFIIHNWIKEIGEHEFRSKRRMTYLVSCFLYIFLIIFMGYFSNI